ncbi:NAD-dependent protein deacylase Sir2 [Rubrobacter xylanophilus DSM 9941]|uniref:SIR2 family NAD-dependent protein deacylase n=1 Tax=Rubrobacter xylanophilus TaxID=49319 RepID=UPI001F430F37|nr:NAD-dependent deacylase [Rubrobacter xylanophilus]QYJ14582.1 NAD-dependent protein deacylase Sir2 [Rubrobacter xylanophilus DSM 9941]
MEIPRELADALRGARAVAALTGSGVSAESGVPTFRDARSGLWERFDPEELATPEAFLRDPKLVWEWYSWRRGLVLRAEPNPAHRALAELERRVLCFTLITQNVDGLHRRAGSGNVIELHGNILRTVCSAERIPREPGGGSPPRCPHCGAPLRPDVVWFGEALPPGALEEASKAARGCEVFLCVGTSGVVYPAAGLPREAAEAGALLVEINPERTPVTSLADFVLRGRAGEALPALVAAAFSGG